MEAIAVVATKPYSIEVQKVEVPEPRPEDVVIRVLYSWISNGTEGSFVRGERIAGDSPLLESSPSPFPHVSGYQKVGVVERVGEAVTEFAVGDLVFATVSRINGMFFDHAGHVSPAITHRSQVWKVPTGVDPVAVSGLVLTQVGYNCGIRPAMEPGDIAVVLGDGMVGQWTAQTLQQRGAKVALVGKHDYRLAMLPLNEGDIAVNINDAASMEAFAAWRKPGIQVLADTVGSVAEIESYLPLMRSNGQISSAGFYGKNGQIDIQKLRYRELTLHTPAGWNKARMDTTLQWLQAGRLQTLPLITHRFPVAEAATAFERILRPSGPFLGIILEWE